MEGRGQQERLARGELIELNSKFHNQTILTDEFYRQLVQAGFLYRQSILISIVPDGSNTFFGQLIQQDGDVVEFDVDLDCEDYSSWKDVTDSFRQVIEKHRRNKSWSREAVAYSLFEKLRAK